jgi:hypothetical protein
VLGTGIGTTAGGAAAPDSTVGNKLKNSTKKKDSWHFKNFKFIYLAGCTMFPHLPAPI